VGNRPAGVKNVARLALTPGSFDPHPGLR
jgi:hypothetical protein